MAYASSRAAHPPARDGRPSAIPVTIKILIAGGFGAGKTTLVSSVSEIRPLRTEEALSEVSTSVYLTEGVLRLSDRKLSQAAVGADPLHSYLSTDESPMTPGRAEQIRIALSPIAVVVHKGERLRLAIAGADADNLERIPAAGPETIEVRRTHESPSFVEIPTLPRQ